jgi:transposase-like protein
MGKKLGHSAEEIIRKLRQSDVLLSQGKTVAEICREIGVSDATYYKWRKDYGGLGVEQARRMKELERENDRLKRAVAELTLDKLILKEAASGNF